MRQTQELSIKSHFSSKHDENDDENSSQNMNTEEFMQQENA